VKLIKFTILSALCVLSTASFAQSSPFQLIKDLAKFNTDLRTDLAGSKITVQELKDLDVAVLEILFTAHRPSQTSLTNLNAVVKAALADGVITPAEQAQITAAFDAVLTSAGVTTTELQSLHNALAAIIASAHITPAEVQVLIGDITAILKDLADPRP